MRQVSKRFNQTVVLYDWILFTSKWLQRVLVKSCFAVPRTLLVLRNEEWRGEIVAAVQCALEVGNKGGEDSTSLSRLGAKYSLIKDRSKLEVSQCWWSLSFRVEAQSFGGGETTDAHGPGYTTRV